MSKLEELRAKHPKQARFIEEYILDLNATKAAMRAGYGASSAQQQGSRLLLNDVVSEAIAELQRERSERCRVKADDVVARLVTLGFSNLRKYHQITEDGTPYLDMRLVSDEDWSALRRCKIKEYKDGKGEAARDIKETEIELKDDVRPLLELGKHLGLFRGEGNVSKEADAAKAVTDKEQRHVDHLAHFAERYRRALPAPKKAAEPVKAKGKAKVA